MSSPWPPPSPESPSPASWPPPAPSAAWVPVERPPYPTLPMRAAVVAVLVTVALLVGNRMLLVSLGDRGWPVAVYIVISATVAYGPMLLLVVWISRTWGTGSLRDDLGFSMAKVDLGWGPLTWLCCFATQIVIGLVVVVAGIPTESNTEGLGAGRDDRGYVIALLVMAVVAAPFVEELVFRGVVLRGLASRLSLPVSVAVQGVLFGVVHAAPERGWGNVGLVLILSGVGCVLGGAAVLLRRLAPSMIAHALMNAIALTLVLTGVLERFRGLD